MYQFAARTLGGKAASVAILATLTTLATLLIYRTYLSTSPISTLPLPYCPPTRDTSHQLPHPPPVIIPPSANHTHTLIVLHGLSTNGHTFSTDFLRTALNEKGESLPQAFPHTKFLFPSGATRKCVHRCNNDSALTNAWFEIESLTDRTVGEEAQIDGLAESSLYLSALMVQEVAVLEQVERGSADLAVWGFSQGCAVGVWGLLAGGWQVGALVGMSGWLPFRRQLDGVVADGGSERARRKAVRDFVRGVVGMPDCGGGEGLAGFDTPVFLGHGLLDEKVRTEWGEQMRDSLREMGVDVQWKGYEELGHSYDVREIDDIENFLRARGVQ